MLLAIPTIDTACSVTTELRDAARKISNAVEGSTNIRLKMAEDNISALRNWLRTGFEKYAMPEAGTTQLFVHLDNLISRALE